MKHSFGYIKDGKVFLKGFLGGEDREIGEVKGDEASTLRYFEARFVLLQEKVAQLKDAIQENQNKGSFLMKLIHLKESLYESDALGDFASLIAELEEQEAFLAEIIQGNRSKNLEIKQGLIQEAIALQESTDWKETTEKFKELKLRWIKTGPVEKDVHEELEGQFNQAVNYFFGQRQEFYDQLTLQAEVNIKVYESLLQQAREAHDLPDAKMAFDISKRIQKEWKAAGKVPAERRQPIWDEFSRLNNRIFSRYKRTLNPGLEMHPRELLRKIEAMVEELKKMAHQPTSQEITVRAKAIQEDWKKLPMRKPKEATLPARSYQFFMDIIFEKAFLEKLGRSKYADFDAKSFEEQQQIKASILKDLLHRDQSELETMQNNSDNFRVETPDFEMMMKKKLSSLKRKIDVKNYVLKQLSPRT
jgi:hypothetical protein